jgi:hypothetical protein
VAANGRDAAVLLRNHAKWTRRADAKVVEAIAELPIKSV